MQFNNLKISTRLIMGFGALIGMVALVSLLGMAVARSTSNSIDTIYYNRLVPITQLKQVYDSYMSVVLDAGNKVSLGLLETPKAIEQVKVGVAKAAEQWKAYADSASSDEASPHADSRNSLHAPAKTSLSC